MDRIAWAAGVFEGEGCISLTRRKSGCWSRRISLGMTDEDVVRRVADAFGVGSVKGPYGGWNRRRPIWRWQVTAWSEIEHVLGLLMPYLGQRRRVAAERMLAHPAADRTGPALRSHCRQGHPFDDANTRVLSSGTRVCRACDAERQRRYRARRRAPAPAPAA